MPRDVSRVCQRCGRNRPLRFYKTTRGRICVDCQRRRSASYSKDVRLSVTYGITLDEYNQMVEAQGGRCAICLRKPRYPLHVDHDHALERLGVVGKANVRGLLCKPCNGRLLPSARDDADTLRRAAAYLEAPPSPYYDPSLPSVTGDDDEAV